ncbi:alpha/beta hydrolase [Halomonas citrativorans]|uniref:Alpha/beta hydrolase n=1 Tax=Halomonas citrativorans TaxID=2742612 RepID=A0ABR9F860_9GAMM|nr:alpha/beta hydrolase [Halomonas citrativorans]MBE0402201.1 alpha/beta hydrolase [Halomonas citrativorans]
MTELTPDLAYSPSHFASEFESTLTRQADAGRTLRGRHPPITVAYGDHPAACLNLFIPQGEGPWPLMVFIHGGYWQELDHTATDFLAERYLARGMAFASIGYGLAPTHTIENMMTQCIQGLEAAYHALEESGGVWSITLGGHSAGAQLAYWVAVSGRVPIDKLVLVSGVYDLTPLVETYVNAPLKLTKAQARALSPQFGELTALPACQVVIAENDPPAFHQQGHNFIALLRAANVQAELIELPGCDHFDVLEYL